MKIINPSDLNIVMGLPPVAEKGQSVAIDSEFFGQTRSKLHRPHGTFAGAGFSLDGQTVYIVLDSSELEQAYRNIDLAIHVYHHAKYDLTQLRRFAYLPQRKNLWDTMLIEQIMYSGYYTDFGLQDVARRYLDVYMDKSVREEFSENESDTMSQEQIEYLAVDVAVTWRVKQAQRAILDETDLNIWRNIELPFLWTILGMSGIRLDVDKWLQLAESNKNIADELRVKYPDVNLASTKQVSSKFMSLGFPMLKGTGAEYLEEIADNCEFAKDLLLFRNTSKRSSTYGHSFVEENVEDGYIYSDIYQIGAKTSRTSSRNPNLQNQPHEGRYRDCFVADTPEDCLIVSDWSSQEPRIAGYLSQDEALIDALNSSEKLYVRIARDALKINITKESPEYGKMKSTILGIFYGMKAKALAVRIGCDVDEAQDMINLILKTYPGIAEYIAKQKKAKDFVRSISGRKIWLNKYDYQWENLALNAPIQGSAAEAMKIAAYQLTCELVGKDFYQNTPLKLLVHDEIVIGSKGVFCQETADTLKRVMISVAENMHTGVTANADVFTGYSWACKH